MNLWESMDFSESVRSFEYTKHAKYQIHCTIDSEAFRTMDSRTIFEFISEKIEIVPFNDYLRRYIYQRSEMTEGFDIITDQDYLDVLMTSFMENSAPYSFTPVKTRMRQMMQSWLKAESVRRTTLFVLGFGMNMSDDEVEETNESLWQAMCHNPKLYVHNENELKNYLKNLKTFRGEEDPAFEEFSRLYDRLRTQIASIYRDSALIDGKAGENGEIRPEDITAADVETVLYTGIPVGSNGNMLKMSYSLLSRQFQNKRMSRQHIAKVLKTKYSPDRFDMITMLFFLYAQDTSYDYEEDTEREGPADRFKDYVDEINGILDRCNMAGIYPVNPYEAFILMCLVTDEPLGAYYDVWDYSFKEASLN